MEDKNIIITEDEYNALMAKVLLLRYILEYMGVNYTSEYYEAVAAFKKDNPVWSKYITD